MVRQAVALAALLVLAGCVGAFPGAPSPNPVEFEPRIAGTFSTGGQCVEAPRVGLSVDSGQADGVWTVHVAGNVTVPGAQYAIEDFDLRTSDGRVYRLDVNTTADTGKPVRECEQGGIVRYEATVEFPAAPSFELQIRHDGVLVSALGSGAES